MLFAAFVIEREPLNWRHLPAVLHLWMQTAGMVAAVCLLVWIVVRAIQGGFGGGPSSSTASSGSRRGLGNLLGRSGGENSRLDTTAVLFFVCLASAAVLYVF